MDSKIKALDAAKLLNKKYGDYYRHEKVEFALSSTIVNEKNIYTRVYLDDVKTHYRYGFGDNTYAIYAKFKHRADLCDVELCDFAILKICDGSVVYEFDESERIVVWTVFLPVIGTLYSNIPEPLILSIKNEITASTV